MWPEGIQPASCSFGRVQNDGVLESPTTRLRQIVRRARPQWRAEISVQAKPWHVSEARWQLESLEGGRAAMEVRDYSVDAVARSGITLLASASVGALTVSTTGWNASETSVVRAGQYLSIGRGLYTARDAVDATSRGEAIIYLNTPIVVAAVVGTAVKLNRPLASMHQDGTSWSGVRSVDSALWSVSMKLVERMGDSS